MSFSLVLLLSFLVADDRIVLFEEPGFPLADGMPVLLPIEDGQVATSTARLEELLEPGRILIWRHGSTFPAELWAPFIEFLEAGGSFLHLGGQPFTRVVTGAPGEREVGPRTVTLLKELRLNQCRQRPVGGAAHRHLTAPWPTPDDATLAADARVSILEPRLSDTRDFEQEDGAPGARDAILRPLSYVHLPEDDPRFPAAAGSFALDRLRGRFAGGRWVFRLVSSLPDREELAFLLDQASRKPVDLRIDPTFGCFHEGEQPSVIVRMHRPRASAAERFLVALDVTGPDGPTRALEAALDAGVHGSIRVPIDGDRAPGLYRVTGRIPDSTIPPFTTGYWIFDEELFTSGDELSFDSYTLLRNGQPEPVIGTTTMSRSVHRKYLFEPNAAEFSDTFAELSSIDINLVRTGIWSGFRKISLDPQAIDEAFLRALEAYYLSARASGIPVIFTFFAFVPESFGGDNPYLDPRAIEGQRAYISAVVSRFRDTREMIWDLINEPSFSAPDKLWKLRPNGDAHESAAFLAWLEQRYGDDWENIVRRRWRLLPDDPIGLPTDEDFEDRQTFRETKPYRAQEYAHFAQDAFEGWIREMTAAIRQAGSSAAITVGQDEGGLNDRPNPLFHHRSVDFASIHTWWYNDAQYWDSVMARPVDTPLLVSETGIMNRELLSGESIRDPESNALLLARKIAHAFAGGAFGVVQWCYEVNPYMASDNEVAIGAKRADGSYKPEHAVLRRLGRFVRENREKFRDPESPEIVLISPASDRWTPRSLAQQATRRALDAIPEAVQVVPEYRTATDLGNPRIIVLPACRGLADQAWQDIERAVQDGATLLCSGWFETDDVGLPAHRIGGEHRSLHLVEQVEMPAGTTTFRFPLDATQSWFAGAGVPFWFERGQGRVVHHPLPLEWSEGDATTWFLPDLELASDLRWRPARIRNGMSVRSIRFADHTLHIAVNETGQTALASDSVQLQPGDVEMWFEQNDSR